jgi:hypothetical protein
MCDSTEKMVFRRGFNFCTNTQINKKLKKLKLFIFRNDEHYIHVHHITRSISYIFVNEAYFRHKMVHFTQILLIYELTQY